MTTATDEVEEPVPYRLPLHGAELRRWRIAVAARVFALAASLGLAAVAGYLPAASTTFLTLCVLAVVMSAPVRSTTLQRWAPVSEGAFAALILGSAGVPPEPLVAYLSVPALCAGLYAGWWSVAATFVLQLAAMSAAAFVSHQPGMFFHYLGISAAWLVVGLGLGLLGSWMRTSAFEVDTEQSRYLSAHRLLSRLHTITRRLSSGLDSVVIAEQVLASALSAVDARAGAVLVSTGDGSVTELARRGDDSHELDLQLDGSGVPSMRPTNRLLHYQAIPLRVGERIIGSLMLASDEPIDGSRVGQLKEWLEEQSLRLETAVIFDEVRRVATTEERNRLAREIHDGIAQEIASMGYLVDDLVAQASSDRERASVLRLRDELTRVVSELRLSIFDLRTGVNPNGGLGLALSDYVREVGTRTPMTVHLILRESSRRPPPEVEAELFRIGQEAVTNARKHSLGTNLWVSLTIDQEQTVLTVEDDGAGSADARPDHYGLAIMRERADRIGANLDIADRPSGGTCVTASVSRSASTTSGVHRDHHSAAHR